jgi:hypothetical protein
VPGCGTVSRHPKGIEPATRRCCAIKAFVGGGGAGVGVKRVMGGGGRGVAGEADDEEDDDEEYEASSGGCDLDSVEYEAVEGDGGCGLGGGMSPA